MLHDLEGEVDVVRHDFESVCVTAKLGFYRNRQSQRIYGVSEHWDTQIAEVYLTAVKGQRRGLERHELDAKYEQVDIAEAQAWWDAEYAATPATEPERFHILSGAIFPIYDKVMGSSGIQSVRIARAMLADGQALVGLNLSPADVPNVKQRLGIGTPLAAASPAEILDLLIDDDSHRGRLRAGIGPEWRAGKPRRASRLWPIGRDHPLQASLVCPKRRRPLFAKSVSAATKAGQGSHCGVRFAISLTFGRQVTRKNVSDQPFAA